MGKKPQLRVHERFPIAWHTRLHCPSWAEAERIATTNVSKGGMFLRTSKILQLGQRVSVQISLPGGKESRIQATVRHVIPPATAAARKCKAGIGVEVDEDSLAEMAALAEIAMLRQREMVPDEPLASRTQPSNKVPFIVDGPLAPAIGIDLGTAFSSIAVAIGDTVRLIPDDHGCAAVPSAVGYLDDQPPLVGRTAIDLLEAQPHRVVLGPKRLLGIDPSNPSVASFLEAAPFRWTQQEGELVLELEQTQLSATKVCSEMFRLFKQLADQRLGVTIEKAVIAVPPIMNERSREALVAAATLGGLETLTLLDEPLAAAMALDRSAPDQHVIVYAFGASFHCALITLDRERSKVIASAGDPWLGGEEFDRIVAEATETAFWQRTPKRPVSDPRAWRRLLSACEAVKRKLSLCDRAAVHVDAFTDGENGDLHELLDQRTFRRLCHSLFARSLDLCKQVLGEADLGPRDIGRVVTVGGLSNIPFVEDGLRRYFADAFIDNLPAGSIALGAGLHAAQLTGHAAKRCAQ